MANLIRLIEFDQKMIAPFQRWYQETENLVKKVFPFDVTAHVVSEFVETSNTQFTPAILLLALITSIVEQDNVQLRNEGFVRN